MSLAEQQSCLARLYVSETYRLQFKQDPDTALAGYHLADDEAAAVRGLDQKMLDVFAATLINKRERRALRAYASSYAWHEATMHAIFRRFVEMHGSRPQPTVHHETVEFGRFAAQALSDPERFAPACSELVRFERASYEATFLHHANAVEQVAPGLAPEHRLAIADGILIEEFDYDVVALDASLRQGATDAEPEPRPASIAFRPGQLQAEQRMLRLNFATSSLLRHCDGVATVEEVIGRTSEELGANDIRDGIVEALQKLVGLRILVNTPARQE
jgi:hypothetical protein